MEAGGPRRAKLGLHAAEHALHGLLPVVRAKAAGVEMPEVHAGHQALIQGTQLQHLVKVTQLIDLAHGLRAEGQSPEAGVVAGAQHLPEGAQRNVQRLAPGAAHQRPGVDDHPARPHTACGQAGVGDVADGLLQGRGVWVCKVDEVGRVKGQGNAVLPGGRADPPGGVLPHMDALAALVFVAVKAQLPQPAGRLRRGLIGKVRGVARRAEPGAHSPPLPWDSSRKGASAA